ncbi:sugar porter family MFS transporter [Hymenobacter mucosus]|uniref:MFS transporter, SP family, arabinose:H+ symporter n=1 Tax=Hymenobacter mucosus TaxID=1411120 RepID=A0A239AF83_9BACT|nr:sugar porter family MFS transporter [Hymenobacter mucosus]SNR94229.1 MFS transporter, SP family, arabinose:H+ symporter [Hymenobacter mucosus]
MPLHASSGPLLRESVAQPPSPARSTGNAGYVYLIATVAALGGLLFGFDTAIINGALVFLKKDFGLTDTETELAASSILFGAVAGAAVAGGLTDRYGRRRLLFGAALLFTLSAVAAALPRTLTEFVVARLAGGLAIGLASLLVPLYIAEIAPARIRGLLVTLNQLAIVTGILLAYVASYYLAGQGVASWRWMFASAAVPSLLFMVTLLLVPESPRWLLGQGREAEAIGTLTRLNGPVAAATETAEIQTALAAERGAEANLYQPRLRQPLRIAVVLAVLQQITGINTILYYGSIIFTEHSGQSAASAIGANALIGGINFAGTIVALFVIDRVGRKPLLLLASGGMTLALGALVVALHLGAPGPWLLGLIMLYVACFAVGLGPGVWVVITEIFPNAVRGRGASVATVALWIACTVVSFTFLSLVKAAGLAGAFGLYAGLSALTFLFVWRAVPETKGRTLEEIERGWHS